MMPRVRTTLTLDPDVASLIEEEVHRVRLPFKQVVNDAIRRGLAPASARPTQGRYRVRPHQATVRPGVDAARLNALVDEMDEGRAPVAPTPPRRRAS
jgi:hypothetical protein